MESKVERSGVTRIAPSPTGALHLGNARTFLANWALARQRGWRVLLRIEDLDGPRIKPGAAKRAIETLRWLGIDWDGEPAWQSTDLVPYRDALSRLAAAGEVYPCRSTRAELLASAVSAPNAGDHELRYPGTFRPSERTEFDFNASAHSGAAWRLWTPDETIVFEDQFAGPQSHNPQQVVGDFIVWTKSGLPSYQLAVVVDDARQEITEVVRGDDLLPSTPRQMLLYDRLALGPPPNYTHLPMIIGQDGRRLAKRHGDTRVDAYRDRGVPVERILGLIAEWCGMGPRRPRGRDEFVSGFELGRLPREPIVFADSDDAWLLDR